MACIPCSSLRGIPLLSIVNVQTHSSLPAAAVCFDHYEASGFPTLAGGYAAVRASAACQSPAVLVALPHTTASSAGSRLRERLKGFVAVRVAIKVSCTPIKRTLHEHIAFGCADVVLQPVSRDMASSRVKGWGDSVRLLSEPWMVSPLLQISHPARATSRHPSGVPFACYSLIFGGM